MNIIEKRDSPFKPAIKRAVENMINEIGELRKIVSIDSMPYKLQTVRQLLRELDSELNKK